MSSELHPCPGCGRPFKFECHLIRHRIRSQRCNQVVAVDADDNTSLSDDDGSSLSDVSSLVSDLEDASDLNKNDVTDHGSFNINDHHDDPSPDGQILSDTEKSEEFVRMRVPIDDMLLLSEEEEEDCRLSDEEDCFSFSGKAYDDESSGLNDHELHAFVPLLEEFSKVMHLEDIIPPDENDEDIDEDHEATVESQSLSANNNFDGNVEERPLCSSNDDESFSSDVSDVNDVTDLPLFRSEVHLLYLMSKYAIPADAYPKFMQWGKEASERGEGFSTRTTMRKAVEKLTSHKSVCHNVATQYMVEIGNYPPCEVSVFPFVKNVRRKMNNAKLMNNVMLQYEGGMGVPYGELNTTGWWKNAEGSLRNELQERGVIESEILLHIIVPIVLFIDATHCDRNGRLSAEPVLCSIGNIRMEYRKQTEAWFFLGLLPKKLLSSVEREGTKKGRGLRSAEEMAYHECLRVILSELIDLQTKDKENGLGIPLEISGIGRRYCHFEVAYVIGDTAGHDALCGHYKAYATKIHRPVRTCYVAHEDLDDPDVECTSCTQKR